MIKPFKRNINIIENQTGYGTRDLIRLLTRVHRTYLKKHTYPPQVRVWLKYQRRNGYTGYAYYHSNRVWLMLPRDGKINIRDVAQTFLHELDHCRGLTHGDMGECSRTLYYRTGVWHKDRELPDISDISVRFTPEQRKGRLPAPEKLERLKARRKGWEAKERRARNAIKKIDRAIRYYERKLAKKDLTVGV